jgi:hypothetical protein
MPSTSSRKGVGPTEGGARRDAGGSKGSNIEVVDWGEAADGLLTEQAEGVLHAAGRT